MNPEYEQTPIQKKPPKEIKKGGGKIKDRNDKNNIYVKQNI